MRRGGDAARTRSGLDQTGSHVSRAWGGRALWKQRLWARLVRESAGAVGGAREPGCPVAQGKSRRGRSGSGAHPSPRTTLSVLWVAGLGRWERVHL